VTEAPSDFSLLVSATAVYLNQGDASFVRAGRITAGWPHSLASFDFDHDGDLDLVMRRMDSPGISVFSNDGAGSFAEDQSMGFPATVRGTKCLGAADFNRDGWIDLAVLVSVSDNPQLTQDWAEVHVFQNHEGTFGLEQTIVIGTLKEPPQDMVVFDVDGSGDPDLVVTTSLLREEGNPMGVMRVFVNGGTGRFGPAREVLRPANLYAAVPAAAADFDGDGAEDIALPGAILFNRSPRPHSLDANRNRIPDECEGTPFHRGDPNGNGGLDIADAIYLLGYLFGDGPEPSCMESGDTDNSGRIDIADPIGLLNYLFAGGDSPAPPGPVESECGADPDDPGSPGDLGCESYEPCKG